MKYLNFLYFPLLHPSVVFPWNFLLMNIPSFHQHLNSASLASVSVIAFIVPGIQIISFSLMEGSRWESVKIFLGRKFATFLLWELKDFYLISSRWQLSMIFLESGCIGSNPHTDQALLWPWASYFNSLGPTLPFCYISLIIVPTCQGC